MMVEQSPALIVVVPLMCALITPIIGLVKKEWCYYWVLLTLLAATVFSVVTMGRVLSEGTIRYFLGNWDPPYGIEYVIDHLNAMMLVIISGISFLVAFHSKESVADEMPGRIVFFYTIFLLQVTGFIGIVITGDVFNLYVFLEIASLAGYALVAIGEDGAPLASFRYIILGTVGACFYLLGVGYLYMVTGSLNMLDLAQLLPELYHSKVILVAFAFFMVGVAVKMALFPLHVWLPDAYTKAPSSSSALLAPLMTKVAAYVMIRIMFTIFEPCFSMEMLPVTAVLSWAAVIAIIAGAVMALAQRDLKRMLVYILVSEVGYIALGVGLANRNGLTGSILHILNDACMMMTLFLIVGAIVYKTRTRTIADFRFLHRKMPLTMAALVVAGLSVIGIPPTCGFFSKWYLILGAVDAKQWIFAVVLLLSSLLNAVLFFRVIEYAYLEPRAEDDHGHEEEGVIIRIEEAPVTMLLPIFAGVAGIFLFGIYSGKIISTIIQYAVPTCF